MSVFEKKALLLGGSKDKIESYTNLDVDLDLDVGIDHEAQFNKIGEDAVQACNDAVQAGKDAVQASKKLISSHLAHNNKSNMDEVIDTICLAAPIFISSISWVGKKTTDTALLGHISGEALSAAALSDLYTACTGVLVQGRVLGILVGQAVGAGNNKLAGIYLQISLVVLGVLTLPVILSWLLTGEVWKILGEPDYLFEDANYYSSILSIALPGMVVSSQLSQFFSAQKIMTPEVNASALGLAANLIFGCIFVLGTGIDGFNGYGFAACPIVTVVVVYVQLLFMWTVYFYRKGMHLKAWNGWSWNEITKERVKVFSELYFPAAFSIASDFWRMSVIGGVAAKLGDDEVAVFNVGYRVFWLSLMLSSAISGATGIKMGMHLGSGNALGALRVAKVGITVSFVTLVTVALVIAVYIESIARVFTNDDDLIDMFASAKWPFTLALFFMNLSVVIERIPMSMGRTADIFRVGFISSWLGQVPATIICTAYWRNDLTGLYTGVFIGYLLLTVLYSYMTYTSDFKHYALMAMKRVEVG